MIFAVPLSGVTRRLYFTKKKRRRKKCPRNVKCFVDVSLNLGDVSLAPNFNEITLQEQQKLEMFFIFNAPLSAQFIF